MDNKELDPPVYYWQAWYVALHDTEDMYLHDDGSIHEGITVIDKQSNCLSTGWFNSEKEAWKARAGYYQKLNIEDTLCKVVKTLDNGLVTSQPLFDD